MGSESMFGHLAGIIDQKVNRGYFQVEIVLDKEHDENKEIEKDTYASAAFADLGAAVTAAQTEGEGILKRLTITGRIVEGEHSDPDEDQLPILYVVDPANKVIGGLHVKFFDYSDQQIH